MRAASAIKRLSVIRRFFVSRVFRFGLVALIAIALVSIFVVKRSFLVVAETSYADITFSGELNTWSFSEATICEPLDPPELNEDPENEAVCNPQLYTPHQPEKGATEVTLNWACGARVAVQADTDEHLVVTVLGFGEMEGQATPCRVGETRSIATGYDLAAGTILVVAPEDWRSNGALSFQGEARVGEAIGPGAVHYLRSGRWEARQTSPILDRIRPRRVTEVIKSGEFSVGAEVRVLDNGAPAIVAGHITPIPVKQDNDLPAFDVVMLSAPGARTEIELSHFGFAEPARIRPDWVDTAITSPLFLAVFALLSLIAVVLQIMKDTGELRRKTKTGAPPE